MYSMSTDRESGKQKRQFVNAKRAAELTGYDVRTIYRKIEDGELSASHDTSGRWRIAHDEITAWIDRNGKQSKGELEQVQLLQQQVERLSDQIEVSLAFKTNFQKFQYQAEERLMKLEAEIEREDLRYALDRIRELLESNTTDLYQEEEASDKQEKLNVSAHLKERVYQSLNAIEKRQLPLGTITVSHFAKEHGVPPRTAVYHLTHARLAWTNYKRNTHKNKNEWWITPEQQPALIEYWETHGKPYERCASCPHTSPTKSSTME